MSEPATCIINRSARWVLIRAITSFAVVAVECVVVAVIFWAMLGATWPIDPSAFAE